jgi:hypothetical protein
VRHKGSAGASPGVACADHVGEWFDNVVKHWRGPFVAVAGIDRTVPVDGAKAV